MRIKEATGLNNRFVPQTKTIALYARVSTARQEEEGTVETQLGALREFARQNNCKVVREYVDDGWSGDILARPSLDLLRQDAKRHLWDGVLIYDPDRLARRYSYQELVMDELRETEIDVQFVTVAAPKSSEEKILHGVRGLFAEYERAKIAERFRLGKLRKIREGHVLVSEAPYGYIYVRKQETEHGYYEIRVHEANVVKMVFEWVGHERLTLRKIVRRLQQLGIKPRESVRGVWNTSTLSTLLRNTTYIGKAAWGASYAVVPQNPRKTDAYRKIKKSSRRSKPREEWQFVSVPAIISEELFAAAGEQLKVNYALSKRNRRNDYLLAGKINCICGRTRAGEGPQHGKYLYYRCSDRVLSFPLPPTCKERGINARIPDELVWRKLTELMSSPELVLSQIEQWMKSREMKPERSDSDLMAFESEISKLREREERYHKAYGAGLLSLQQLHEYAGPIKERVGVLERLIEKATGNAQLSPANVVFNRSQIESFAEEARKVLPDLKFVEKRAIVLNTVEKIVCTPQQVQVYGYLPVDNNVKLQTVHRHGLNATRHSRTPVVPFEFSVALPPPLRRGVDYGFLPGTNISSKGDA